MIVNPIVSIIFKSTQSLAMWNKKHHTNYMLGESISMNYVDAAKLRDFRDTIKVTIKCEDCGRLFSRSVHYAYRTKENRFCTSCVQTGHRSCHWGSHRSDDLRKRQSEIMKGENNPFYGKKHTEEAKEKSRIANIGNSNHKGHKHSALTRNKISENLLKSFRSGKRAATHKNSVSGNYHGITYQGNWELALIEHLEAVGIKTIERGPSIIYQGNDGKEHTYLPDFFIKDIGLVIEVKSKYEWNNDLEINMAKKAATEKQFDYIVVVEEDYEKLDEIIMRKRVCSCQE